MAEKLPLVYVDGQLSQLPTGDTADGAALGSLTAGSGLVGGGDLQTGNKRLDVALASSASGVIFVGDSIGMDGADLVTASAALASGVAGSSASAIALASGVAAQPDANTALASGNAALDLAVNFSSSSSVDFTASSVIQAGNPVGLDDLGKASVITSVTDVNSRSFGSAVVFESADTDYASAIYDSTNDRVVIAYRDEGNSSYGTAIVGTVSGTSISFGTPVVFESAFAYVISSTYDSTNDRVVIAYQDTGNSNYGTAVVGTVSGTSISFGTAVVYESASITLTSTTYDSTNDRVVIAYEDTGNSGYGTAVVGAPGSSTLPTISSRNNFIGSAQTTVASGEPVTINVPRSIGYNNTGLSTGYFYYVDPTTSGYTTASGEPSTWNADPSFPWRPIAKAVSSSGLLILETI